MNLPNNIQYVIERVADGEGNLPETVAEAKMVLAEQKEDKLLPWMKSVPEYKDTNFNWEEDPF